MGSAAPLLIHDQALVLRRWPDGEEDMVVRLLTAAGRSVALRLHRIRKSKRRSQLLSEPGTLLDLQYYQHADRYASLKEGMVVERYSATKASYADLWLMSYLLELIDRVLTRGEASPGLWRLLSGGCTKLEELVTARSVVSPNSLSVAALREERMLLLLFFKLRLLRLLGLLGDVGHCSFCGVDLRQSGGAELLASELRYRCRRCAGHDDPVDESELQQGLIGSIMLQLALARRFDEFRVELTMLVVSSDLRAELIFSHDQLTNSALQHYLGRELQCADSLYAELYPELDDGEQIVG